MSKQKFGRFEVIRPLGKGAMGEVYLARDPAIGREVAIKVILASSAQSDDARARFEREAKAAGILNHQNIVTVYEFGSDEGDIFIVMEYVKGHDLEELIRNQALSCAEFLEVLAQVCDGLGYAHRNGIIHRDIKPANVRVIKEGSRLAAKVMDFGVARIDDSNMTATGMVVGTVSYMAPEYIKTGRPDARSDLFAVGVMLYECLSGRRPFSGDTTATVLFRIVNEPPEQIVSNSSADITTILEKILEKDPEVRYQTADELAKALRTAKDSTIDSIGAVPPLDATRHVDAEVAEATQLGYKAPAVGNETIVAGNKISMKDMEADSVSAQSAPYVQPRRAKKNASLPYIAASVVTLAALGAGGYYVANRVGWIGNEKQADTYSESLETEEYQYHEDETKPKTAEKSVNPFPPPSNVAAPKSAGSVKSADNAGTGKKGTDTKDAMLQTKATPPTTNPAQNTTQFPEPAIQKDAQKPIAKESVAEPHAATGFALSTDVRTEDRNAIFGHWEGRNKNGDTYTIRFTNVEWEATVKKDGATIPHYRGTYTIAGSGLDMMIVEEGNLKTMGWMPQRGNIGPRLAAKRKSGKLVIDVLTDAELERKRR